MADDIMTFKRPNILYLKGVSLKDLVTIEEVFEERLVGEITTTITVPKVFENLVVPKYESLPNKFVDVESWPKTSTLKCWNCCLSHTNRPVFIPLCITIDITGKQTMDVYGHFCTFNCAVKYTNDYFRNDTSWDDKIRFLKILYKTFTGNPINILIPALERTSMKSYCGEDGLSEREYREKNAELNKNYSLTDYKMNQICNEL